MHRTREKILECSLIAVPFQSLKPKLAFEPHFGQVPIGKALMLCDVS